MEQAPRVRLPASLECPDLRAEPAGTAGKHTGVGLGPGLVARGPACCSAPSEELAFKDRAHTLHASSARRHYAPANTLGQSPFGSSEIKIRPSLPVFLAAVSTACSNRQDYLLAVRSYRSRDPRSDAGSSVRSNPPNQDRLRHLLALARNSRCDRGHGLREENRRAEAGPAAAPDWLIRSEADSCATVHLRCRCDQPSATGQHRSSVRSASLLVRIQR